ncbi:MAG TPA: DUF3305 domain-containing protein [Stellaceae bacterium]|nr:DUF3305 domain-containing protein [Alphaproteobacteria bacterium]HEV2160718.1 DUF3305 domain-containing protein [Stellaceae bacterium]
MSEPLPERAGSVPARNTIVPLGVVFERRRIAHTWQEWRWKPVAVIPGAPAIAQPALLREGDGWALYHLATLDLELFADETKDYRLNLSQKSPLVYVLWRSEASMPDGQPEPFRVTVCHSETQDYLDGGDVAADGVVMPVPVLSLLQAYVRTYHVDVPFKKRQRTPLVRARQAKDEYG